MNYFDFDIDSFKLISKVQFNNEYKKYDFVPIVHNVKSKLHNSKKGIFFNKDIASADDILYHISTEFNGKNIVEYLAIGLHNKLKAAMYHSIINPDTEYSKYIIFRSSILGYKYSNPAIGIFINNHKNANPNICMDYEI